MGNSLSQNYQERTPLSSRPIPSKQSLMYAWKEGFLRSNEEKRKDSLHSLANLCISYDDIYNMEESVLNKHQKDALWNEYSHRIR